MIFRNNDGLANRFYSRPLGIAVQKFVPNVSKSANIKEIKENFSIETLLLAQKNSVEIGSEKRNGWSK